jgi:uncharacterized protein (TIGR02117 family)
MSKTVARRIGIGLAITTLLFVFITVVTARWGDSSLWPPAPGAPITEIFIVNHGYHAGIAVPRAAFAEQASRHGLSALGYVATRFADFDWLEIGWGDEGFYRYVPAADSLTVAMALRALFRPGNPSVLHVVGVKNDPRAMFANSELVPIGLSNAGFARVAALLDSTFARSNGSVMPQELGPGLYGTSLFFRGNGAFHLFNVCNHWTARVLDAAGIPTAPVLATLPFGLLLDLRWRSGLVALPPATTPASPASPTAAARGRLS